jgi:hypothetical protein
MRYIIAIIKSFLHKCDMAHNFQLTGLQHKAINSGATVEQALKFTNNNQLIALDLGATPEQAVKFTSYHQAKALELGATVEEALRFTAISIIALDAGGSPVEEALKFTNAFQLLAWAEGATVEEALRFTDMSQVNSLKAGVAVEDAINTFNWPAQIHALNAGLSLEDALEFRTEAQVEFLKQWRGSQEYSRLRDAAINRDKDCKVVIFSEDHKDAAPAKTMKELLPFFATLGFKTVCFETDQDNKEAYKLLHQRKGYFINTTPESSKADLDLVFDLERYDMKYCGMDVLNSLSEICTENNNCLMRARNNEMALIIANKCIEGHVLALTGFHHHKDLYNKLKSYQIEDVKGYFIHTGHDSCYGDDIDHHLKYLGLEDHFPTLNTTDVVLKDYEQHLAGEQHACDSHNLKDCT